MNVLGLVPSKDLGQTLTVTPVARTLKEMGASIQYPSQTNWVLLIPDGGPIRFWLTAGSPALSATSGVPAPDGLFVFMNIGDIQDAKFWAPANTRLQVVYLMRWGFPQGLSC